MPTLSKMQRKILLFIQKYHGENDISPSVRDIAQGLGLGNTTAYTHICALMKKGFLTKMKFVPRSYKVLMPIDQTPTRNSI